MRSRLHRGAICGLLHRATPFVYAGVLRRAFRARPRRLARGLLTGALLGALPLLPACASRSEPTPVEPVMAGAQLATLAPGESATFGPTGALRITFREVEADSRCPVDVQCVWSGDAAILLRIELGAFTGGTTLHTTLQPQRIVISDGYALRLVAVSPLPRAGVPIAPGAYRVTVEVSTP